MVYGFVGTRASLRGSKIISKNQETLTNRDLASIINWLSLYCSVTRWYERWNLESWSCGFVYIVQKPKNTTNHVQQIKWELLSQYFLWLIRQIWKRITSRFIKTKYKNGKELNEAGIQRGITATLKVKKRVKQNKKWGLTTNLTI